MINWKLSFARRRSEIAMKTKRLFKAVWDFKPVWLHFRSHVNVLLLALFFSRERFMMAALNDLFKCGFWLPRFWILGACWFSTFTKLFSKEVKVTLLWWNLDNSSDLKQLKLTVRKKNTFSLIISGQCKNPYS